MALTLLPSRARAPSKSTTTWDVYLPKRDPLAGRDIKGYLALDWHRMEAWFEEDEEVFDPAMVPFAATSADQNERDSKALPGMVGSGRRTAQAGC
jgi:hypothetical protein